QAVASGLFDDPITWRAAQSGGAGTLIYASGTSGQQQMAWVDRTGKMIGMLPPYQGEAFSASVSPDGSRIAVSLDQGLQDIWTEPASGGALSRLTFGPLANLFPNWAPDGRTIAYVGGTFKENIAARPADGGSERILLPSHDATDRMVPMGYTADGRTLICTNSHAIFALDVAHTTLRTIATVPNAVVLSVRL